MENIIRYLKPNFSKHPLNWVFTFLLFFGSFSITSVAKAETFPTEVWEVLFVGVYYQSKGETSSYMMNYASTGGRTFVGWDYDTDTGMRIRWHISDGRQYTMTAASSTCPSANSALNTLCYTPIPVNCPAAGDPLTFTVGLYDLSNSLSQSAGTVMSFGGCGFTLQGGQEYGTYGIYCEATAGDCYSTQELTATGLEQAPSADNPLLMDETTSPQEADRIEGTDNTSDITIIPKTTEQVGDQTIEVETTVKTETRADGVIITEKTDKIIAEYSPGITKTTTTTTTTTTELDGSKTVQTETTTAFVQAPKDVFIVGKEDGVTTITNVPGSTAGSGITVIEAFDPTGKKTGETSTGSQTGTGEAEDGVNESDCAADPFSTQCIGTFQKTAKGEFADGLSELAAAKAEYQALFDSIQSDIEGSFNGVADGGAITSNNITIRGVSADIGLTKWVPTLDSFNLGALTMALAGLMSFFIMMGGSRNG
ncbi:MAG: hypothetical protein V7739_17775 [Motiliproteus sp.]